MGNVLIEIIGCLHICECTAVTNCVSIVILILILSLIENLQIIIFKKNKNTTKKHKLKLGLKLINI